MVEELPATSSYIMENGIPPGSILVNPHTGRWWSHTWVEGGVTPCDPSLTPPNPPSHHQVNPS